MPCPCGKPFKCALLCYAVALALLNFAISLLLRRAALFLWITPFEAALSSSAQATRSASIVSTSPTMIDCSAFLTIVLTLERSIWFRMRFRSSARMCFFADCVFANEILPQSWL